MKSVNFSHLTKEQKDNLRSAWYGRDYPTMRMLFAKYKMLNDCASCNITNQFVKDWMRYADRHKLLITHATV